MEGWVKLSRSLIDKPIFKNEKLLKVWIWCLLKATHKEYEQLIGLQKITLLQGQFIFGRKKAAEELNLPESTVWRLMKVLADKNNPSLEIETHTKYSIVNIINWSGYQLEKDEKTDTCESSNNNGSEDTAGQQVNNKWTTSEQQMDTNKNVKNVKNVKNNIYSDNLELNQSIIEFVKMRKSIKKPMTERAINMMIKKLNKMSNSEHVQIEIINQSIMCSWTDIYELKQQNSSNNKTVKINQQQQQLDEIERVMKEFDRNNVCEPNQEMCSELRCIR